MSTLLQREDLVVLRKQFTEEGKDDSEDERAGNHGVEARGGSMWADKEEEHRGHHQVRLGQSNAQSLGNGPICRHKDQCVNDHRLVRRLKRLQLCGWELKQ